MSVSDVRVGAKVPYSWLHYAPKAGLEEMEIGRDFCQERKKTAATIPAIRAIVAAHSAALVSSSIQILAIGFWKKNPVPREIGLLLIF